MKYQILAVGLKDNLFSHCREHFVKWGIGLNRVIGISEAAHILKRETFQLLVLDMKYLRNKDLSDWILTIRYDSFIPIIVLSDFPEVDIGPTIRAGADACFDSNLPPSALALLLLAQIRRITEYNNSRELETVPFQVGDIVINPSRRLVWVRGQHIKLLPREFSLLLYFMKNSDIVLTPKQICEHAWKKNYTQSVAQSVHDLRQKIEVDPANPIYIKTVYRVGYRFAGCSNKTSDN